MQHTRLRRARRRRTRLAEFPPLLRSAANAGDAGAVDAVLGRIAQVLEAA